MPIRSLRSSGRSRFALARVIFAGGLVMAFSALSACDDDPTVDQSTSDLGPMDAGPTEDAMVPDDAAAPDVTLEVGYGLGDAFRVLGSGETVSAVAGTQGGYHLDMGFRVRGLSATDFSSGEWLIRYEARDGDGVPFTEPITRILTLTGVTFDGVGQVRSGDRVFLSETRPDTARRDPGHLGGQPRARWSARG